MWLIEYTMTTYTDGKPTVFKGVAGVSPDGPVSGILQASIGITDVHASAVREYRNHLGKCAIASVSGFTNTEGGSVTHTIFTATPVTVFALQPCAVGG